MPVSILEGDTFVVSDRRGDISISREEAQGLFQGDTRFLSRWVLTVNGAGRESTSCRPGGAKTNRMD
jgi:N-terminal domain of (some) glycogen debranching enzymes